MIEEVTIERIKELIKNLPYGTTSIEKIILASEGTVQTLMSVIYNTPITINVKWQTEGSGVILRHIALWAEKTNIGSAFSVIHVNENPVGFITGIREKNWGIGQLINAIPLENTKREILNMTVTDEAIARVYKITGDCNVTISETFSRAKLAAIQEVHR